MKSIYIRSKNRRCFRLGTRLMEEVTPRSSARRAPNELRSGHATHRDEFGTEQRTTRDNMKLTPSEVRVLRFYRDFRKERFCCSIKTIAKACSVGTRTVQRANAQFQGFGILSWVSGNSASWRKNSRGQANKYRLRLTGIEGSAITPSMVRGLRRLIRGKSPNQPN
jgi:hypothetical protein